MAALPPSSTARVKIQYTVSGFDHVVQVRYKAPDTTDDVIAGFNDLITAIGPLLLESTFVQASVAAIGSDIFNPLAGDWPVGWGDSTQGNYSSAQFYDFVGRSLDGRRVRLTLFGAQVIQDGGDFRINTVENANVDAAVQVLNDAEGTFLSINGFQPVWYSYVNTGVNAYWRNKIR